MAFRQFSFHTISPLQGRGGWGNPPCGGGLPLRTRHRHLPPKPREEGRHRITKERASIYAHPMRGRHHNRKSRWCITTATAKILLKMRLNEISFLMLNPLPKELLRGKSWN